MPGDERPEATDPSRPLEAAPAAREVPRVPAPRARTTAALAVTLGLAVFLAPALRPGVGFSFQDTGRLHAPTKRWIAEELSRGSLPQWNPYSGLGNPLLANVTDAVLHPFGSLLLLGDPTLSLKLWILLSIAAAAAGGFLVARQLGWGGPACAVAALGFALSGPLVSSTANVAFLTTYAAFPWVFAAAHRWVERSGPGSLASVATASYLCIAGGDPQGWAIAVALLPAWGALVARTGGRARAAGRGAIAAVAAAVAAAPVIVPLALWLPHSDRAGGLDEPARLKWNLHPRRIPELAIPGVFAHAPGGDAPAFEAYAGNVVTRDPWYLSVYLGAAVLALAALGATRDARARWLVAAGCAAAWAALGTYAGAAQLAAGIPLASGVRYFEKLAVWVALPVALAAARGVEALGAGGPSRLVRGAATAGMLGALGIAALAAALPATVARVSGGPPGAGEALAANLSRGGLHAGLALAAVVALFVAAAHGERARRIAASAGAALAAADLAVANAGAYVLSAAQREDPPALARAELRVITSVATSRARPDRFAGLGLVGSASEWGRRTLAPAWNVPFHVGSEEGYAPLLERRWSQLALQLTVLRREAALGLFGFSAVVVPSSPSLASLAGVAPPHRVVGVDPEVPAFLVEVPHRPRAYLAGDVRRVGEAEARAFALAGGAPGVSVVEGPVRSARWPDPGEARILEDRPGDTLVGVRAVAPTLLVLNDLFAPGWTAAVDGREAEIVRANYVARGVWMDPGEHEVRFRYRTPGLAGGWAIALAGGLALAGWGAWRRRHQVGLLARSEQTAVPSTGGEK